MPNSAEVRRSSQERKAPARFADSIVYVNFCAADAPETIQVAVSSPEAEMWQ